MSEALFRGIQIEDRGLDPATGEVFLELQSQLRRSFKQTRQEMNNTKSITINVGGTQSDLEDALNRGLLRVGMVVWMYISWGEAVQLERYGWIPSDGSNGSCPLIPPQGTSNPQRGLVAVAHGNNPWTLNRGTARTGGGATHSHGAHELDFSSDIEDHDSIDYSANLGNHDDVEFSNAASHPQTAVSSGAGTNVLIDCPNTNHYGTQGISGHSGTQPISAHSGSKELSHDAANNYHPYAEGIPMMKVR